MIKENDTADWVQTLTHIRSGVSFINLYVLFFSSVKGQIFSLRELHKNACKALCKDLHIVSLKKHLL